MGKSRGSGLATALAGLLAASLWGTGAPAQPAAEDPTWPCVQRKVAALSLGLMWPHPVPETAPTPEEAELADVLALRRVTIDEAETRVAAFMEAHPDTGIDGLGLIFAGVFDHLSRERSRIMAGIERYADSQHALSQSIDAKRQAFKEAEAADPPDFDRLDALEAEIDWDERIFRDRAQSLTYVCESPVLLERRLYSIAQILLAAAPSD